MTSLHQNSEQALETYVATVGPMMECAGAKLVARYEVSRFISVAAPPEFVSIVEYPDEDAIRQVFEDPAYVALHEIKREAFSRYDVCLVS